MTYLILFCFIKAGSVVLLDGPESFDIEGAFRDWKAEIVRRTGPEPNVMCYGLHVEWIKRHMEVLAEYQREYDYLGDFTTLFVAYLVKHHDFQRREHNEVRLV